MADHLIIRELVAECRLGVSEAEQEKPQPVWIDLELEIDAARAARRDAVSDAVDYAALASAVKRVVGDKPYHLLETLAEDVAALILERFATEQVFVRIKKRALPGIDYAAVEIVRSRRT